MENDNSKSQLELAKTYNHETYMPKNGLYESSMLVAARMGTEVESTWKVVLTFLRKFEE